MLTARARIACRFCIPPLCLLAVFATLCVRSSQRTSFTIDEFMYVPVGLYHIESRDLNPESRNPPLMRLAAGLFASSANPSVPEWAPFLRRKQGWWLWSYATLFMRENAEAYHGIMARARLAALCAGVLLGIAVFLAANRLFGRKAGWVALVLYCFEPNILAHSGVATTDMGVALFCFVTCLVFARFMRTGAPGLAALCGSVLALAVCSKFTSVLLLPLMAAGYLAQRPLARRAGLAWRLAPKKALVHLALFAAAFTATTHAAYLFSGGFRPFSELKLKSPLWKALQSAAGPLPAPLPEAMIEGLDDASYYARHPEVPGYFNGRWRAEGSVLYFPEIYLFKSTPALLLVFLLGAASWMRCPRDRRAKVLALLVFPVCFAASLILFCRVNYGIRFLLPAFPFLLVALSGLVTAAPIEDRAGPARPRRVRIRDGALVALVAFHALACLGAFPHYIAYANLLAGGPLKAHRYFIDSNLDWGQDLKELKRYMDRQGIASVRLAYYGHDDPELYGIDYELMGGAPAPGYHAASISFVMGKPYKITYRGPVPLDVPAGRFAWIRDYEPIATAGRSILIYRIDSAHGG